MPKQKTTLSQRKAEWVKALSLEKYVQLDGSKLVCKPCQKSYGFTQRCELEQHSKTSQHVQNVHRFNTADDQKPLIRDALEKSNPFTYDLCEAFVAADIPFSKLDNAVFYNFLEKYSNRQIPSRRALGRYLPKVHANVMDKIIEHIGQSHFWVQVDETTDKAGRYISNVIVGQLNKNEPKQGYLVISKPLVSTNHATIVQSILDSFQVLWPGRKQEEIAENFLLLLTDGVNYMLKAGRVLKSTYPGLMHVTCVSHALNLVAEQVRANFPQVDKLVAALKKVFKKAPSRILAYKELNPELSLPPEVVITRWGTWLKVTEFYAQNFGKVKSVIDSFDPAESAAIFTAQELMSKPSIVQDLTYISANFSFLNTPILDLQQRGASLSSTMEILDEVRTTLAAVNGSVGHKVLSKMDAVIAKNADLAKIRAIVHVLNGVALNGLEVLALNNLSPDKIACFKFAPLTTVDAERSFSMHKGILTDNRMRFTVENLEMDVVSHSYFVT